MFRDTSRIVVVGRPSFNRWHIAHALEDLGFVVLVPKSEEELLEAFLNAPALAVLETSAAGYDTEAFSTRARAAVRASGVPAVYFTPSAEPSPDLLLIRVLDALGDVAA